jgi:hypothetical protein
MHQHASPERPQHADDPGPAAATPGRRTLVDAEPTAEGGGSPLPGPVRAKMERAFGVDLGGVRVRESDGARTIAAIAYTRGDLITFAPGAYDPESEAGQRRLAHELAHVVQQREGRVAMPASNQGAPINADAGLEAEADALGDRAARGEVVRSAGPVAPVATGAIQRIKDKDYLPRVGKVDQLELELAAQGGDASWRADAIETLETVIRGVRFVDDGTDDQNAPDDRGPALVVRCNELIRQVRAAGSSSKVAPTTMLDQLLLQSASAIKRTNRPNPTAKKLTLPSSEPILLDTPKIPVLIDRLLDLDMTVEDKLVLLCELDSGVLNELFFTIYSQPKLARAVLGILSRMNVLDLGPGGNDTTSGQTDATWWKLARIQIHAIHPTVGSAVERHAKLLEPSTARYFPEGTVRDDDMQFEALEHKDLLGLPCLDLEAFLGEHQCLLQPEMALGRTLIYKPKRGDVRVCVKVAKPHEDTKELSKQAEMQEVLLALKGPLHLKSATPRPYAVGKMCLFKHHKRIQIAIAAPIVEDETPFHRVFVYIIDSPDYLKYLNRTEDLAPTKQPQDTGKHHQMLAEVFDSGSAAALFDLCTLAGEGWVFTQLIDLYHGSADPSLRDKRPEDGGRYAVLTNLLRSRYGLSGRLGGMGEVSAIEPAVEYPNWRKSGLADEGDSRSFHQIGGRVKRLEGKLIEDRTKKRELPPHLVEQPKGTAEEWCWEDEEVKASAQSVGLGYGKESLRDPVWTETHHVKNIANSGGEHVDSMLMAVYLSEYLFSWLLTTATFYVNDPQLNEALRTEIKRAGRGALDEQCPTIQLLSRSLHSGFLAAACGYTWMQPDLVDLQICAFIDFDRMAKQIAFFMTLAYVDSFEAHDDTMAEAGLFPDDAEVHGQDRMVDPHVNENWMPGLGTVNKTATRKKQKSSDISAHKPVVHDLGASNGQMPLKEFEQAIYRLVPYLLLMRERTLHQPREREHERDRERDREPLEREDPPRRLPRIDLGKRDLPPPTTSLGATTEVKPEVKPESRLDDTVEPSSSTGGTDEKF